MSATLRAEHATRCALRAIQMAITAASDDQAAIYTDSAIRFVHAARRAAQEATQ